MKSPSFLADENIPRPLVAGLRNAEWDVAYVAEQAPGISDTAVLQWARIDSRIILTEDKDFGELTFRMQWNSSGVLLLRVDAMSWKDQLVRVQTLLESHAHRLKETFTIVEAKRVRFRPMPAQF